MAQQPAAKGPVIKITTDGDVLDFAGSLEDPALECRSNHHHFQIREVAPTQTDAVGDWYVIVEVCDCGSERSMVKDINTGREQIIGMKYAPGYLALGLGRMPPGSKQLFRNERMKRFLKAKARRA